MARKARNTSARTRDQIFGEMVEGLGEAISIAKGEADPATYRVHAPGDIDVRAVREKTGLSQDAFAGAYGLAPGTVRDWEQRRRAPDQAARMYLHAIQKDPKGVYAIIAANKRKPEYKTSRAEMKRIRVSPNPKRRTVPARAKTKASGSRSSRSH